MIGDIAFDKKGDVSHEGYIVGGKKKDRYVLYTWKKGPTARSAISRIDSTNVITGPARSAETRRSISLQKGWMRGSGPRMTADKARP